MMLSGLCPLLSVLLLLAPCSCQSSDVPPLPAGELPASILDALLGGGPGGRTVWEVHALDAERLIELLLSETKLGLLDTAGDASPSMCL